MDALCVAVLIVFIGTYLVISTEKINRTALSLMGMGIVAIVLWAGLALGFPDGRTFSEMAEHIPWATVIFVMAIMVIVGVAGESGMFQYLALRLSTPSAGDRRRLFIRFILFVWGSSLMFDTPSTMLTMTPLTIEVCKAFEIDFKPFIGSWTELYIEFLIPSGTALESMVSQEDPIQPHTPKWVPKGSLLHSSITYPISSRVFSCNNDSKVSKSTRPIGILLYMSGLSTFMTT